MAGEVREQEGPRGHRPGREESRLARIGYEGLRQLGRRRNNQKVPYALGYVQYGAAREVNLGMAALENKAGKYVRPSGTSGLETLLNAEMPPDLLAYFPDPSGEYSYPIVTFTWVLLYKKYDDPTKTQAVKDFIGWCLTSGQDFSEAAGNVRLAPHVFARRKKLWRPSRRRDTRSWIAQQLPGH